MIISGEYDETDVREVNHKVKKKTLQRGTIDIFVMAVPRYEQRVGMTCGFVLKLISLSLWYLSRNLVFSVLTFHICSNSAK